MLVDVLVFGPLSFVRRRMDAHSERFVSSCPVYGFTLADGLTELCSIDLHTV